MSLAQDAALPRRRWTLLAMVKENHCGVCYKLYVMFTASPSRKLSTAECRWLTLDLVGGSICRLKLASPEDLRRSYLCSIPLSQLAPPIFMET